MKNSFSLFLLFLLLWSCSQQQQQSIKLSNTTELKLKAKSLELNREELEQKLGALPEVELALLTDKNGTQFPAQLDDLDLDGKWDVLFSQVDFDANETKTLSLSFEAKEKITVKTNIRFADYDDPSKEFTTGIRLKTDKTEVTQNIFQFEGIGWENDVVAFRNYFDARNGIDIFGKTTTNMALDSCGLKGGPTYHEMRTWGMDILKVANSLGAGALALETPTGLYRVGPNCFGTYSSIKEGPLRSLFDMDFDSLQIDGKTIQLKHRVAIEAGKPYYNSQVWIKGIDDVKLVTGIVNLHSDSVFSKTDESVSYFFTHDNQAYDGEKLGMAIIVPSNNLSVQTAPEEGEGITQTFYTALEITQQPVEFYFMVGWEKQNQVYATKDAFEHEIKKQALALQASIKLD